MAVTMIKYQFVFVSLVLLLSPDLSRAIEPITSTWPQWGGPNRNFVVDTTGLAEHWPQTGPRRIWERELGEGYNTIACDDDALYTMYRKADEPDREYTIALDRRTGATLWESGHTAPILQFTKEFPGPNASPLIVGERLFTFGLRGVLTCFQKKEGIVVWEKYLAEICNAPVPVGGFSASPIAFENLVIIPIGCAMPGQFMPPTEDGRPHQYAEPSGQSLLALDQSSGEIVWKSLDFHVGHTSPLLIRFDGRDMLIMHTCTGVTAVNPLDGSLLWHYPFPQQHTDYVIASPVWNGEDTLFCTTGETGLALNLSKDGTQYHVKELWRGLKAAMSMGTPVFVDDQLIGSRGGGTSFLLSLDLRTGDRLWYNRAISRSTVIAADGKLILLSENGVLTLATATREGVSFLSQYQLLERYSFTAPTLVGTTLYVRDTRKIMALDLR